jgi:hypothetical protein
VELPRQIDVVGVSALAANEGVVFLASDRLTDAVVLRCSNGSNVSPIGVILHETLKPVALRAVGQVVW